MDPLSSVSSRGTESSSAGSPPPPPNPSEDSGIVPTISSPDKSAPSPTAGGDWDVAHLRPETALKILCRSVQTLANVTGDIPPTPPLSRPNTPKGKENSVGGRSRPPTPIPRDDVEAPSFQKVDVGCPESSACEPSIEDVGAGAEPLHVQQGAMARKFFCKRPPPITLEDYLMRLQRYCPMSAAVYLAAGVYIYKLAVEEKLVPLTNRTMHRLVLGSLRVAMKALEDLRYPQHRFAGVGGVGENELKRLESSVCFLTGWTLQVDEDVLFRKNMLLHEAAQHATATTKLPANFQPRLPLRRKAPPCAIAT